MERQYRITATLLMVLRLFYLTQKKTISVKLFDGFHINNRVRTSLCKDCDSNARLIAGNLANPNLVLFGCDGQKCRQRLIRLNLNSEENRLESENLSVAALEDQVQVQEYVGS